MKGKKIGFRKRTKKALSRTLQIILVTAIFVKIALHELYLGGIQQPRGQNFVIF
jgi:hypothetical protein